MKVLNSLKVNSARAELMLKDSAPTIMVVAGVIGMIGATVMACKATLKAEKVVKKDLEKIEEIKSEVVEDDNARKAHDKELMVAKAALVKDVAKIYAPSLVIGTAAIATVFASNDILRKRNASLLVAFSTLDNAYRKYRAAVVERFGKDVDRELAFGLKKKEITEEVEENGKKKKVKKTVELVGDCGLDHSPYAKFFDSSSREWDKDPEYNLMALRMKQQQANDMLKSRGFIFLNEVYRMLDIEETEAGQYVGWVYDPRGEGVGDNYVDFGIYEVKSEAGRRFVNGLEPVILLDFNVDGDIRYILKKNKTREIDAE